MAFSLLLLALGFLLGIPASFIAAHLYTEWRTMALKNKLEVAGTWGEFVPDSEGHRYSLGHIYYDKRRNLYAFDGTNFKDDGAPFCHWETVVSYVDIERRQFFYVFAAKVEEERDRIYYGFGVLNLAQGKDGALAPADGHYVSASVDGKGMSHSMARTNTMEYRRGMSGRLVVTWLRPPPSAQSRGS